MKMLFIAYNIALDEELVLLLRRNGVEFYTKFPRVQGVGPNSGPRLDNHVWPGANCAMLVILPTAKAEEMMTLLQDMRNGEGKNEGIYAFLTSIEKATV